MDCGVGGLSGAWNEEGGSEAQVVVLRPAVVSRERKIHSRRFAPASVHSRWKFPPDLHSTVHHASQIWTAFNVGRCFVMFNRLSAPHSLEVLSLPEGALLKCPSLSRPAKSEGVSGVSCLQIAFFLLNINPNAPR